MQGTLEIQRRVLGADHPETIISVANLGTVFGNWGKYSDAEPLLRGAYEHNKDKTWRKSHAQALLGASFAGQKSFVEAEPLLIAGYGELTDAQMFIPADRRQDVTRIGDWIITMYREMGKPDKAIEWREKIRAIQKSGPEGPHLPQ